MSIVAVHGPNTMFVGGAGGGGTSGTITTNGGAVVADISNAMKFNLNGVGDRQTYAWTFNDGTAAVNAKTGVVTFATPGAKIITETVSGTGTTPTGGPFTYNVVAGPTAGPRMVEDGGDGEESPDVEVGYDPAAHTVDEVKEFVTEHPEEAQAIRDAEEAGKNRATLITWLEEQSGEEDIYDPADYTVDEVVDYAIANPDQIEDLIAAEEAGKNRSTLISQLEALLVEAPE